MYNAEVTSGQFGSPGIAGGIVPPPSHRYQCKVRKPADFDEFWRGVMAQAAAIPLAPEMVLDPMRSSEDVEVYRVFYDSLDDLRIAGWYCLPASRQEPLPGLLNPPGYKGDPGIPKAWSSKGYAALAVAPRGKVGSNRQFNPGYPGLLTHNIVDRNTYGYKGFFVDAWRGVDFLLSRPEVDSARIGVTGSSQGGGLTITTAAMRPEIKAAAAGAPYLCGFIDAIGLTDTYPYQEINDYLSLHPDSRDDVESTLAYFDGINFADKVLCPVVVNIGLQDNVCPPETGFGVFDAISSPEKRLHPYEGQGHSAGSHVHAAIIDEFLQQYLEPARK